MKNIKPYNSPEILKDMASDIEKLSQDVRTMESHINHMREEMDDLRCLINREKEEGANHLW